MTDQTPAPQPPAPEKGKNWFARHKIMSALGALVLVIIVVSATSSNGSTSSNTEDTSATGTSSTSSDTGVTDTADAESQPASNPDEGTVEIIVKSTGSSSGSVTYMRPDSDSMAMSQDTSAKFPWDKTFKTDSLPMGWNMNAQQNGGGKLTCIVKQDGKVITKNRSKGDYAMVTCMP